MMDDVIVASVIVAMMKESDLAWLEWSRDGEALMEVSVPPMVGK